MDRLLFEMYYPRSFIIAISTVDWAREDCWFMRATLACGVRPFGGETGMLLGMLFKLLLGTLFMNS